MVNGHSDTRNTWHVIVSVILSLFVITPYIIVTKAYVDYNQIFPFMDICLNGDKASPPLKQGAMSFVAVMLPNAISVMTAIVMDSKTYIRVKSHVASADNDNGNNNSNNQVRYFRINTLYYIGT